MEAALAASPLGSLRGLRAQLEAWRGESREAFDADAYYDGERADASPGG